MNDSTDLVDDEQLQKLASAAAAAAHAHHQRDHHPTLYGDQGALDSVRGHRGPSEVVATAWDELDSPTDANRRAMVQMRRNSVASRLQDQYLSGAGTQLPGLHSGGVPHGHGGGSHPAPLVRGNSGQSLVSARSHANLGGGGPPGLPRVPATSPRAEGPSGSGFIAPAGVFSSGAHALAGGHGPAPGSPGFGHPQQSLQQQQLQQQGSQSQQGGGRRQAPSSPVSMYQQAHLKAIMGSLGSMPDIRRAPDYTSTASAVAAASAAAAGSRHARHGSTDYGGPGGSYGHPASAFAAPPHAFGHGPAFGPAPGGNAAAAAAATAAAAAAAHSHALTGGAQPQPHFAGPMGSPLSPPQQQQQQQPSHTLHLHPSANPAPGSGHAAYSAGSGSGGGSSSSFGASYGTGFGPHNVPLPAGHAAAGVPAAGRLTPQGFATASASASANASVSHHGSPGSLGSPSQSALGSTRAAGGTASVDISVAYSHSGTIAAGAGVPQSSGYTPKLAGRSVVRGTDQQQQQKMPPLPPHGHGSPDLRVAVPGGSPALGARDGGGSPLAASAGPGSAWTSAGGAAAGAGGSPYMVGRGSHAPSPKSVTAAGGLTSGSPTYVHARNIVATATSAAGSNYSRSNSGSAGAGAGVSVGDGSSGGVTNVQYGSAQAHAPPEVLATTHLTGPVFSTSAPQHSDRSGLSTNGPPTGHVLGMPTSAAGASGSSIGGGSAAFGGLASRAMTNASVSGSGGLGLGAMSSGPPTGDAAAAAAAAAAQDPALFLSPREPAARPWPEDAALLHGRPPVMPALVRMNSGLQQSELPHAQPFLSQQRQQQQQQQQSSQQPGPKVGVPGGPAPPPVVVGLDIGPGGVASLQHAGSVASMAAGSAGSAGNASSAGDGSVGGEASGPTAAATAKQRRLSTSSNAAAAAGPSLADVTHPGGFGSAAAAAAAAVSQALQKQHQQDGINASAGAAPGFGRSTSIAASYAYTGAGASVILGPSGSPSGGSGGGGPAPSDAGSHYGALGGPRSSPLTAAARVLAAADKTKALEARREQLQKEEEEAEEEERVTLALYKELAEKAKEDVQGGNAKYVRMMALAGRHSFCSPGDLYNLIMTPHDALLMAHIAKPLLRIIDCRRREEYLVEHIRGAIHLTECSTAAARNALNTTPLFEQRAAALDPRNSIVFYGAEEVDDGAPQAGATATAGLPAGNTADAKDKRVRYTKLHAKLVQVLAMVDDGVSRLLTLRGGLKQFKKQFPFLVCNIPHDVVPDMDGYQADHLSGQFEGSDYGGGGGAPSVAGSWQSLNHLATGAFAPAAVGGGSANRRRSPSRRRDFSDRAARKQTAINHAARNNRGGGGGGGGGGDDEDGWVRGRRPGPAIPGVTTAGVMNGLTEDQQRYGRDYKGPPICRALTMGVLAPVKARHAVYFCSFQIPRSEVSFLRMLHLCQGDTFDESEFAGTLQNGHKIPGTSALEFDADLNVYPNLILDPWLFLGDQRCSWSLASLLDLQITHIINISTDICNYFEDHPAARLANNTTIKYLTIRMHDDQNSDILSQFNLVFNFIDMAKKTDKNAKIMVHCQMGISRSASLIIAYIMHLTRQSLQDVFYHVKMRRYIVQPNRGFWAQLGVVEKQLRGGVTTVYDIIEAGMRREETSACNCCTIA